MKSIKHLMKLDLRSLALTRVLLGLLAFYDLSRRLFEIGAFFNDNGILTRAQVIEQLEINYRMTLLSLNGSYSFALILLLIGLVGTIFMTIGWRTRIATFLVWIVTISFQARFPEAATTGGDMLLRIFLFWSLFLPMNAYYSVDRALSETKHEGKEYVSIFSSIWIIQVMLLYIMTFFFKWAPVYHTDFNAVYYILNLDFMTTDFGKWLSHFPLTMKALSIASWGLEGVGPLLLLIPVRRDLFRSMAVVSFWLFHLGIGATLHLGNFVPICLIIWAGLIPTAWWNYLGEKIKSTNKSLRILYYSSEDALGRKLGLVTKEMLLLDGLKIAPSSVSPTAEKHIENADWPIVEDSGFFYTGAKALELKLQSSKLFFIRAMGRIPLAKIKATLLTPDESFGAQLLEAKEKGEVSITGSARDDDDFPDLEKENHKRNLQIIENVFTNVGFGPVRYRISKLENIFGCFILALVITWNIEGLLKPKSWYIGSPFDEIMFTFHLNQGWAMFAPHPQRSDGWFVLDGNLKNGTKWDVLNNKAVTFETPENWHETYATDNWKKFLDNLHGSRDDFHLLGLGRYLCRTWNNEHDQKEQLMKFELFYMQEFTNHPDDPPSKINKIRLWQHQCF